MTRKEINNFLANTRVYVNGKSREIQEKLFSLGYKWNCGESNVTRTYIPFLYIYSDMTFTCGNDMECFSIHENKEITAEQILTIKLAKTVYRPFKDKDECWKEMFKHKPFGWIICKKTGGYDTVGRLESGTWYHSLFEYYTFADGTPFGIKE